MTVRVLKTKGFATITGEFRSITSKAVQVHDGEGDLWIPLDEIEEPAIDELRRLEVGQGVTILVPDWIARERGLE